jgi:sigma-E factor negative regulatory protein RseC
MFTQNGVVTKVSNKFILVETQTESSCKSCDLSSKGCGTSVLADFLGRKKINIKVANNNNNKIGDKVTIAIPEKIVLKASLIIYLFPLLFMFLSLIIYEALVKYLNLPYLESISIFITLSSLGFGFIISKHIVLKNINYQQAIILR